MTDKELLELAAKAAEIDNLGWLELSNGIATMSTARGVWNPLIDDGDALRLAVKLRLMLSWHEPRDLRVIWWGSEGRKEIVETWTEAHDSCACSRHAIVRAAAEIGKEMK